MEFLLSKKAGQLVSTGTYTLSKKIEERVKQIYPYPTVVIDDAHLISHEKSYIYKLRVNALKDILPEVEKIVKEEIKLLEKVAPHIPLPEPITPYVK